MQRQREEAKAKKAARPKTPPKPPTPPPKGLESIVLKLFNYFHFRTNTRA